MAGPRVLQSLASNYPFNARVPVISPSGNTEQFRMIAGNVINRTGGNCDVGLFREFGGGYHIYTLVGGVATDVTSHISGTNIFDTTNNDGFIVGSTSLFNLIGFMLSQGQAGAPVYSYQYWNGAAWATLNTITTPANYGTANENLIIFGAPVDWSASTVPTGATGLPIGQYYVRGIATTHGTQVVTASSAWVAQMISFAPQVANNALLSWNVGTVDIAYVFNSGDGLLPYFSIASVNNLVTGQYWIVD